VARPLPSGIQAPSPRRGWGWGRGALLLATLLGWAPIVAWAAGLILSGGLGCPVRGAAAPCPTALGDVGGLLYGLTVTGGWLMIPAALLMIPTGLAWAGLLVARVLRGRA